MGKLYDALQRQLNTEHKEDAENCIKIYNRLKDVFGSVWESEWRVLTEVRFEGIYPNSIRIYKPSPVGKSYIKEIEGREVDKFSKKATN